MSEHEALELVRAVVTSVGMATDALGLDTDLRDDLGVDSIDLLDILFELGERRGAAIALEQLLERREPTRVRTIVACLTEASEPDDNPADTATRPRPGPGAVGQGGV